MNIQDYQITKWCQRIVKDHIQEGAFCIDATMGKGQDTEFLCRAVGLSGSVLALDIQEHALICTQKRLEMAEGIGNYRLILDSHSQIGKYAKESSADAIMFNLGYLPGGDHTIATRANTTIKALEQSLSILKSDGIISVCIYSGGDSGYEEKNQVLSWLKQLDRKKYLVLMTEYLNRPNDPPLPVFVIKK